MHQFSGSNRIMRRKEDHEHEDELAKFLLADPAHGAFGPKSFSDLVKVLFLPVNALF